MRRLDFAMHLRQLIIINYKANPSDRFRFFLGFISMTEPATVGDSTAMAKPLTEAEVRHIATLSRLQLSDEEVAMMTEELSAIVGYVDQLSEVDVEGVVPTAHAVDVQNVFRDDTIRDSIGSDKALANAPEREGSFFKVPKVLDQDTV